MSAIIDIGTASGPLPPVSSTLRLVTAVPAAASGRKDSLEISPLGSVLSRAAELSSLSLAKTRAIREQIESGTYETPERINGTVSRLLDVLA